MKQETWKQRHIRYARQFFEANVQRYEDEMLKDGFYNDRQVYCNLYKHIMSALESLPEEPHLYVCVAVNDRLDEDFDILRKINKHFTGVDIFVNPFYNDS